MPLVGAFLIGLLAGELHYHNAFSVAYSDFKGFFTENRIYFEVGYFLVTPGLLLFAYCQYRQDKSKGKMGALEYAHRLFREFTNEILVKAKKYDSAFLKEIENPDHVIKRKEFNEFLNHIDWFAAAFTHGVADLESGEKMMGDTYCQEIDRYTPTIIAISKNDYREGYENIFQLLDLWKGKDGANC